MEKREEFLKRIQNITIEKEPKTDGFELTKETREKQLKKYDNVLKSEIFKSAIAGEGR